MSVQNGLLVVISEFLSESKTRKLGVFQGLRSSRSASFRSEIQRIFIHEKAGASTDAASSGLVVGLLFHPIIILSYTLLLLLRIFFWGSIKRTVFWAKKHQKWNVALDRTVSSFHLPTWRIIPVSKWVISMVTKSPKSGCSPYKWPNSMAYKWGAHPNHVSKSWEPILQGTQPKTLQLLPLISAQREWFPHPMWVFCNSSKGTNLSHGRGRRRPGSPYPNQSVVEVGDTLNQKS